MIFRKIISYSLFLASMTLHAEEKTSGFNQQIEQLKMSKKVTVVLSMPDTYDGTLNRLESLERYEGDNLRKMRVYGCNFSSHNNQAIKNLVNSLQKQGIAVSDYHHLPYATVTIYFNDANNKEVRLSLDRQHLNESTVDGEMQLLPQDAPLKVSVGKNAYREIYNWVSNEGLYEDGPEIDGYHVVSENNKYHILGCKVITKKTIIETTYNKPVPAQSLSACFLMNAQQAGSPSRKSNSF